MKIQAVAPSPLIFAPAILAAAIFVGYVFVWLAGAREMRNAVESWAAEQRSSGATADIGSISATGFPFFLRGALKDVQLGAGAWALSAPQIFLDTQPLAPKRFIISSRKPFIVEFGGEGSWRIEAPDGRAAAARDGARGWTLDVETPRALMTRTDRDGRIETGAFLLSAAPNSVDATRIFFGVDASDVLLAEPARSTRFDALSLAFAVSGLSQAPTSAERWRDGGGVIEIQSARIAVDDAVAEFSGSLTIGADGFPEGQINAEISKPQLIAPLLAAAGLIRASDVDNARTVLSLIAIAGGGKISAPLALENGEVRVAGIKIGETKPVIGLAPAAQP